MIALLNFYRRHKPDWIEMLRHDAQMHGIGRPGTATQELLALERRLPPEMVAWAKLNR